MDFSHGDTQLRMILMVNIGICIVGFVRFDYRRVYNWSEALDAYSIVPSLSKLILQIKLKLEKEELWGTQCT